MTLIDYDNAPGPPGGDTLQEKFEEFHALNPWVYERLERLILDMLAKGHQKVGLRMLFEVLRWEHAMSTIDPHSKFKLNNNYSPRYARLLISNHVTWADVIETRILKVV